MTKKQLILGAIISTLALAMVFGFESFIANRVDGWATHSFISEPLVIAIDVGCFIKARPYFVAAIVVAACFGLVWILGRLPSKQETPAN